MASNNHIVDRNKAVKVKSSCQREEEEEVEDKEFSPTTDDDFENSLSVDRDAAEEESGLRKRADNDVHDGNSNEGEKADTQATASDYLKVDNRKIKSKYNPYILFSSSYKRELQVSNPDISFVELTTASGDAWNKLTP